MEHFIAICRELLHAVISLVKITLCFKETSDHLKTAVDHFKKSSLLRSDRRRHRSGRGIFKLLLSNRLQRDIQRDVLRREYCPGSFTIGSEIIAPVWFTAKGREFMLSAFCLFRSSGKDLRFGAIGGLTAEMCSANGHTTFCRVEMSLCWADSRRVRPVVHRKRGECRNILWP